MTSHTPEELFALLRELLTEPPCEDAWQELLSCLQLIPNPDKSVAIAYVEDHATSWPIESRVCAPSILNAPYARLCRTLQPRQNIHPTRILRLMQQSPQLVGLDLRKLHINPAHLHILLSDASLHQTLQLLRIHGYQRPHKRRDYTDALRHAFEGSDVFPQLHFLEVRFCCLRPSITKVLDHLPALKYLDLSHNDLNDDSTRDLAQAEELPQLQALNLDHQGHLSFGIHDPSTMHHLSHSPSLPKLHKLGITQAYQQYHDCLATLQSPHTPFTPKLRLRNPPQTSSQSERRAQLDTMLQAIDAKQFPQLDLSPLHALSCGCIHLPHGPESLDHALLSWLQHNPDTTRFVSLSLKRWTPEGLQRLAQLPHLDSLRRLKLHNCPGAALAFASSPTWTHLQRLSLLDGWTVGDDGLRTIVQSPNFASIRSLKIFLDSIAKDGLVALAQSPHATKLQHLSLRCCDIHTPGARAIAQSTHLQSLRHLDLTCNYIDSDAVIAFAQAQTLPQLSSISFNSSWETIDPDALLALLRAPHRQNLHIQCKIRNRQQRRHTRHTIRHTLGHIPPRLIL